jgi:peptidoglycan/xylan/chitin deacetylase (PgdA/CDA1 family)
MKKTRYWVTTPEWLKWIFPKGLLWKMPPQEHPTVYLTFDDGPHPTATPFILAQLAQYDAHATFFCIGKNVALYPEVYKQLTEKGHRVANHTHNHLNGWRTDDKTYLENIATAAEHINSNLFRPPYGRIKSSQARLLQQANPAYTICMWTVLSGDFDPEITPEKCLDNVLKNIQPGAIIVFHDSDKAWPRMSHALPEVLAYCKERGWRMEAL